jgi:hypothetical protein
VSVRPYSHNSSLGGRRQKPIGAMNSAGIGEGAKPKQISKFFPQKLVRSGKSYKMGENEYNLRGRVEGKRGGGEGKAEGRGGGGGGRGGGWALVKHVLLVSSPGKAGYSASSP